MRPAFAFRFVYRFSGGGARRLRFLELGADGNDGINRSLFGLPGSQ